MPGVEDFLHFLDLKGELGIMFRAVKVICQGYSAPGLSHHLYEYQGSDQSL